MSDLIRRQLAIDTEGLDEEIRCEMCRNQMKTYRGCDGNCKYDEKLYEKIMQILDERIKPLPSAQPEIVRCKDCICAHSEAWLSGGGKSEAYAYGYCGKTNLKILPYDYCSRGERRTDEPD